MNSTAKPQPLDWCPVCRQPRRPVPTGDLVCEVCFDRRGRWVPLVAQPKEKRP